MKLSVKKKKILGGERRWCEIFENLKMTSSKNRLKNTDLHE